MSGEHTEYVTQLITSKSRLAQLVEQKPYQEYQPTQQNLPTTLPPEFGRNPTPPLPTKEILQIVARASQIDSPKNFPNNVNQRLHVWPSRSQSEGEFNAPKMGKMYVSLAENIYSHLKEYAMRENYTEEEIIDVGFEIADAADLLRILGRSTDEIELAGEKAQELTMLLDEVIHIQNRALKLFKETLSLLRSMKFDQ